jgi:hypothetical protein
MLASICHEVKPRDIPKKTIQQNQFEAVNNRVSSSNSLLVEASCGFFTLLWQYH